MKQSHSGLAPALSEWKDLLGEKGLVSSDNAFRKYGWNTIGATREVTAALRPSTVEQIPKLVTTAHKHGIPLYPISTGNNWGYGSTLPVVDDCVLVDLSGLDRILEMDPESGLVTIEPGVTQRSLRVYLDRHNLPFLVPVTGAGPDCSLVGNALERGYGITPYADHFGAVMSLEAVLPNGDLYRTPLSELGGSKVDQSFKWGIGPYLDGIFTQGNFGIVTQMTICLAPIPDRVEGFFFGVSRDGELETAVECIRNALRQVGSVSGSINLMNRRRVLSMMEPYPFGQEGSDGIIPGDLLHTMARRNQVMEWMGAGALYGHRKLVKAAHSIIRKELRPVAKRLVIFTPIRVAQLLRLSSILPGRLGRQTGKIFGTLDKTMRLLAGEPSEIALPLAYWKAGEMPEEGKPMNPAKDGCGLIWYSPLVPMVPDRVCVYSDMVNRICTSHGIEPLITLTSLSDRCYDSTVPILFDPSSPRQVECAHACYQELLEEGKKEGFVPYRTSVTSMSQFTSEDSVFWNLARDIKRTVDEKNIIAPGRYSLM